MSFEQDEEGPPLHPEVGFESDAGADGDVPLTPKPITAQVVGRTDVGLVREHNEDNYILADLSTGSRDSSDLPRSPMAGLLLGRVRRHGRCGRGRGGEPDGRGHHLEMMRRSVPAAIAMHSPSAGPGGRRGWRQRIFEALAPTAAGAAWAPLRRSPR